ncbi:MAG: RluA family pseudouridine synthase [Deltaproteobacteria bacterium]|nr:RluA family pseudouridine synthase [Deltaproteobacteria bacterium]
MTTTHSLRADTSNADQRIDVFVAQNIPDISRSFVKTLTEKGLVLVNGNVAKASRTLKPGDMVEVTIPQAAPLEAVAEDIALDILYEDKDVVVVNKPRGLTTHPGAGRPSATLVNALMHHTKGKLSGIGAPLRPGIVHRLDKDTSGAIVAAKNDKSHTSLAAQFREHSTSRTYHTLVWGKVKADSGTITLSIGRDIKDRTKVSPRSRKTRHAETEYKVLRRYKWFTLLEITPKTGRTHQIRTHLLHIHHPVVGDPVYGRRTLPDNLPGNVKKALKAIKGQMLHAMTLGFTHPSTKKKIAFKAPYPLDMANLLKTIEEC